MPLERVLAHRQSSASRRSDPGEGIWRLLEPVARELGLDPAFDWTVADGRPIPEAWGGSAGVPYF